MELMSLFLLPFFGGIAAAALAGRGNLDRWVSLAAMLAPLAILGATVLAGGDARWISEHRSPWLPDLGVSLHFAIDGFSAALCALTLGLGAVCVAASWHEIRERTGMFHLMLCWTIATAIGVFISFDLLLFVFFFEAMLIPSFLLIAMFGHGDREAAAIKYLIFNGIGGLGLLAGTLALVALAGGLTFDAFALSGAEIGLTAQVVLLLTFALAFLVKLPALPFHVWLPDAHTQAPTAGSILLAGVLLKTGGYGLFRFAPLLFPDALSLLAPGVMALGVAGALYGGVLACGQTDAKRLIAYTSVAHMGLVLLGIGAGTQIALSGAAVEMIAHAFSSSALFLLVGALSHRTGSRDMGALGGLQGRAPRFTAGFVVFFAAALAMPGTANFLGEILVILGTFQVSWPAAVLAITSLVISVVYATTLLRGVVLGKPPDGAEVEDLRPHELWPLVALAAGTLVMGVVPQIPLSLVATAVDAAFAPLAP